MDLSDCGIPLIESAFENGRGIAIRDDYAPSPSGTFAATSSTDSGRERATAKAEAVEHRNSDTDGHGEYSYQSLFTGAATVASALLDDAEDLAERRIAFLVPSSFAYVLAQWGTWLAGGIAVPLCTAHPSTELDYVVENAEVDTIITHPEYVERIRPVAEKHRCRLLLIDEVISTGDTVKPALPRIDPERRAMIVYTSGTTSRPKGVVSTHRIIAAQISCLIRSWGWSDQDSTLLVLPLHHVHGIINVLSCSLWIGATCEMMKSFNPEDAWQRLIDRNYTLFMAVPTVYVKLARIWDQSATERQQQMAAACRAMRLMISGSAALPVSVLEKWRAMVGHTFLERYGMTEIGMAISNPLKGERRPGYIGQPLPGVSVRLVDDQGQAIDDENIPGEIQIKGPNVFLEYWKKPDVTAESFKDGWFCTGDSAIVENGYYRILGRNSVDIIKSGGYKISALEIEEELRKHPVIEECSVVGIEDDEWGEQVCVAVVIHAEQALTLDQLKSWCKDRLANYKIPRALVCCRELPRNVMGKVMKPEVKELFQSTK